MIRDTIPMPMGIPSRASMTIVDKHETTQPKVLLIRPIIAEGKKCFLAICQPVLNAFSGEKFCRMISLWAKMLLIPNNINPPIQVTKQAKPPINNQMKFTTGIKLKTAKIIPTIKAGNNSNPSEINMYISVSNIKGLILESAGGDVDFRVAGLLFWAKLIPVISPAVAQDCKIQFINEYTIIIDKKLKPKISQIKPGIWDNHWVNIVVCVPNTA